MSRAGAPTAARRVPKPWGYELIWAEGRRYAGKILHIERGEATSFQYHRKKEETVYVLHGVLQLETEGDGGRRERRRIEAGEGVHLPPGCRHRLEAIETCDLLEVSTPELDDVVRLEDSYGREDK